MSDYSKSTNFTTKDTLPTGNSNKIVKGTELDTEFTAIASAIASKANTSSPDLLGTPTAPTAASGTNTTQIASCAFVLANAIPSGLISLWSGTIASIPSGWYLCNGSNGTPDLRNKFVVGADADVTSIAKTTITGSATQTGGSKDAIVVSHTHTINDPQHTHAFSGSTAEWVNGTGSPHAQGYSPNNAESGTQSAGITISSASTGITNQSTGSSGTNANLPPYYALAYIMKA